MERTPSTSLNPLSPIRESMPSLSPVGGTLNNNEVASESAGPSFKVVAWEHTTANGKASAAAVQDCDVVAVELMGTTSRGRRKFDAAANVFVSSTATEAEAAKARKRLQSVPEVYAVLECLKGSDKRIVTIDVNQNDPSMKRFDEGHALGNRALNTVNRVSNKKTKALLRASAIASGQGSAGREATVVGQLHDLAAQYEGTDAKIGVLAGAIHTPIMHILSRSYPAMRTYAAGKSAAGQAEWERVYFSPTEQMERYASILPGVQIPEGVVDRALLDLVQRLAHPEAHLAPHHSRARRFENVSDAEVSEIVLAIDGLKAGLLAKLQPNRTLAKMDAKIEAELARIEQTDRALR